MGSLSARATDVDSPAASLWEAFDACFEAIARQQRNSSSDTRRDALEGIGLAAWDAQVNNEIAQRNRYAADDPRVSPELEVLDELAELTARYADNGPWKAAEELFGAVT